MKNTLQLQSTVLMKIAKIGYIVLSAALCILGVMVIASSCILSRRFWVLCGAVFLAFGCIRVIGFFSKDLYRLAFQFDLEFGILIMIFGLLAILRSGIFSEITRAALGVLVLADALFKIRIILEAKKFGVESWWILLIIAVIAAAVGGILIFYSGRVPRYILGAAFIAEGVLSLSSALALVKIIHHQIKDEK